MSAQRFIVSGDSDPGDSVVLSLRRVACGDERGMPRLWRQFYLPLVGFFRRWFGPTPRTARDEEDLALETLFRLWRRAGALGDVDSRESVTRVVLTMAWQTLLSERRRERRMKRNADATRSVDQTFFDLVDDGAPPVAAAFERLEELERLQQPPSDRELHEIVRMRLEGETDDRIAAALGVSRSTVQRRLREFRKRRDVVPSSRFKSSSSSPGSGVG